MNHRSFSGAWASALVMTLCAGAPVTSQERNTENTLKASATSKPPAARIGELGWLRGEWVGHGLGGDALEVWSGDANGAMVGHFRSSGTDGVRFYELMTLVEVQGSLVMRLKHFNADLKGWEEKDKTVDFPLARLKDRTAYFEGLTYRREGDTLTVHVALSDGSGGAKEETLVFKRSVGTTR